MACTYDPLGDNTVRMGSWMHLNSNVPTLEEAKRGVKRKWFAVWTRVENVDEWWHMMRRRTCSVVQQTGTPRNSIHSLGDITVNGTFGLVWMARLNPAQPVPRSTVPAFSAAATAAAARSVDENGRRIVFCRTIALDTVRWKRIPGTRLIMMMMSMMN